MKLILVALILAVVFAGLTIDKDTHHGHSDEYFKNLKASPNKKTLNIHILPHTHDDVGWLKTPDQYFSGDRDDIQRAGVTYVLDGIYDTLMKDPKKKFTYVEMAFFQKWWLEQPEEIQQNIKSLVDNKQLEFVNAGMSMSDEASVHHEDFINNMKAGHDFLKNALDYRPTIGWHIDPFGHHSASAALFAEMGFNAWFFARMDRDDKARRLDDKEMEWIWRPFNESLGSRAEIFTHMMYNHYSAPPGFCFNEFCTDSPIIDDKRLRTYNIEEKGEELHDYLVHMGEHYRTNHLLVPFGDDFNYLNAQKMFLNIDKLINYMNDKYDDINMFYSTPYEYLDALHDADIKWPTKYDDLFPYSDGPDAYWTGYFTSRANFKSYVREASSDLNSHSIVLALDNLVNGKEVYSTFKNLFDEMGVMQHHDAVSGTEKQHVAEDYADTLTIALDAEKKVFLEAFKELTHTDVENLSMCKAHNSTFHDCPTKALEDKKVNEISFFVVNPSNRRATIAKIPVPNSKLTLHKMDDSPMESDIICAQESPSEGCYMYFSINMSTYGMEKFKLKKSATENHIRPTHNSGAISNGLYSAQIKSIDEDLVFEIHKSDHNEPEAVLMNYMYYESFQEDEGQRSGAYIFRPAQKDQEPKRYNGFTSYDGFQGQFVNQLRLYGEQVDTVITGNIHTDFVEIETRLKGIPMSEQGQEVILQLSFDKIKNGGVFYTDSMGLEMQKRIVDYRPTWKLNVTQPISENYYPVNHGIYIKDDKMTLEVLNDRSQGGTSLHDGEIEFMIQRRTYADDSRGVGEALNETNPESETGRGIETHLRHYLRFYNNTQAHDIVQNSRWMQREIDMPLVYVFGTEGKKTGQNKEKTSLLEFVTLPDEIKMIAHPQHDGSIFLRFENIMDLISSSSTVTVNVDQIAKTFANLTSKSVQSVVEVSNTGLYTMEEMKKLKKKWKGIDYTSPDPDYSSDPTNVELSPQRIRSFVLTFSDSMSVKDYLVSF